MKVRKYNDRALRVDHFHDAHIKILSKMHDYCSIDLVSHIDFLRYKYMFMINLLLIASLIC